jgi:hypothetical protein
MRNASGNIVRVQPSAGGGQNWIRLQNGSAAMAHQTLGIERSVDTIAGARYTLQFQYAAGPGWFEVNGRIGVYVDGQLVATYSNTSPRERLQWYAASFQFDGNGQARRVTIQLEGGNALATSTATIRSANLDQIRIVETLPVSATRVYAIAGGSAALPQVLASLADTDGSEALVVAATGLPAGAVLADGTRSLTVGADGLADLSGWNLATLSLLPPAGFTGTLQIGLSASATEASNQDAAVTLRSVEVIVLDGPAAETPASANPFVTPAGAAARRPAQSAAEADPAPPPARTAADEADEEQKRQRRLGEAWLEELERSAQAQWKALMGVAREESKA